MYYYKTIGNKTISYIELGLYNNKSTITISKYIYQVAVNSFDNIKHLL